MTTRVRQKDERTPTGPNSYQVYSKSSCANASPVWSQYYSSAGTNKGRFVQMTDVVGNAPNRRLGWRGYTFNAMTSISVDIDSGSGVDWETGTILNTCTAVPSEAYSQKYRRVSSGFTTGRHYSRFGYPLTVNLSLDTLGIVSYRDLARASALASAAVNSKRGRGGGDTNLYESLAEANKTLRLLASYLEQARKLAKSAQQLNPREFLRGASSIYLMTRYGFSPTVKDVFSTLEGLRTILGDILETNRASAQIADVISQSTTFNDVDTYDIQGAIVSTFTTTARCTALDHYTKSKFDALSLSFKNFATVGWELVPYSFVVDWFVNVGDLIGSLIPNFGVTSVGSCTAVTVERTDVYSSTGYTLKQGTQYVITPPTGATCKKVSRAYLRSIGLPTPSLAVKVDFRFDHITRALDASALLVQQLRKVPAAHH